MASSNSSYSISYLYPSLYIYTRSIGIMVGGFMALFHKDVVGYCILSLIRGLSSEYTQYVLRASITSVWCWCSLLSNPQLTSVNRIHDTNASHQWGYFNVYCASCKLIRHLAVDCDPGVDDTIAMYLHYSGGRSRLIIDIIPQPPCSCFTRD